MEIKNVRKVNVSKSDNRIYIEAEDPSDNDDFSLQNGCKMVFREGNTLEIIAEDSWFSMAESLFVAKGVKTGVAGMPGRGNLIEFDTFGGYWFARFIGADDLRDTYAPNEPKEITTSLHSPFCIICKASGTQGVLEIRRT